MVDAAEERAVIRSPLIFLCLCLAAGCGCATPPSPDAGDAPTPDGGLLDALVSDAGADVPIDAGSDAPIDATEIPDVPPDAPECELDVHCAAAPCESVTCAAGRCVRAMRPEGASCDDGDLCTHDDVCSGEVCAGIATTCGVCASGALTTFAARWLKRPATGRVLEGGDVVVAGFGDGDLWLGGIDADGAHIVDHGFGHRRAGDAAYAMDVAPDGTLVIGGYSQVGGGGAVPWIVRTDARATTHEELVPLPARGGTFTGLRLTSDGSIDTLARLESAAWMSLTPLGVVRAERSLFPVRTAYGTSELVELAGGDLAFAAETGFIGSESVRVARIAADGAEVWTHDFDVYSAPAITAMADGGVVVGGRDVSAGGWLVRLDASGDVVWETRVPRALNATIEALAADGDRVLAAGWRDDRAWIARIAADGAVEAEAELDLGVFSQAFVVLVTEDGIAVAGSARQTPGAGVDAIEHAWIVRAASVEDLSCL